MSQTLSAPSQMVLSPEATAPAAAPAAIPTAGGAHVPALDGLRGLAILLVLTDHLARIISHGAVNGAAARFARCGWIGVDLFFVLSGFLITGILYDTLHSRNYFRNFYLRRVLRIFPLYYGVVFVTVVLLPLLWGQRWFQAFLPHGGSRIGASLALLHHHQIWLWFYGTGLTQSFKAIDWQMLGHFWSLGVEEHFYLVWPVIVFLVGRRKPLMVICGILVVAAVLLRMVLVKFAPDQVDVYFFTPCRMDTLALGSLLALAVRGPDGIRPLVAPAKWTAWICGSVIVAFAWQRKVFSHEDLLVQTAGFSVIAFFFAALLILSISGPADATLGRFFSGRGLRLFGKYSYAMYVFHYLAMLVATPDGIGQVVGSYWLGAAIYALLVMSLTVAVALLSWHLYEKQFLRLKRFFPYEQSAESQARSARRPALQAA